MDQASSLVHYSRTLPVFKVLADDVSGRRKLHLLEGAHHISELRIVSLENVRCLEESSKAKLADKHNLSKLTLEWTTGVDRHLKDIDLLEQPVPPRGLKDLYLNGYSCIGFPGWVMDVSRHFTNLISVMLRNLPNCSNLPALGQLPHLEKLFLGNLPSIKKIGWEFCGGKGAFRRLSSFNITCMVGLEEWNTTYSVEDGVEEFMFPVLDSLTIDFCPRLRFKPCPPTFRECKIQSSDLCSFEEVHKISHHTFSSRATKLELSRTNCQSMEVFDHFSALEVLTIHWCDKLTCLPESMRHLSSLQSLTLQWCESISALPEWLGDLSSLKTFVIKACGRIKSLPSCIHQLKKLEKLEIRHNRELKKWCESEENKMKLAHINIIKVSSLPSCTQSIFGIQVFHYTTTTIYVQPVFSTSPARTILQLLPTFESHYWFSAAMAEAVAGLLTSAFVGIAKDKLGSAIAQQANLLWNFDGDLEDMMDTLETISAVLEDAEKRSVRESSVRLWLKRLKDAALDISDILEDYQDISDQATTAKMLQLLSCLPMGYKRIVVANRMKTARENLSKINKDFQSFNFRQGTTTTIEKCYDKRETTSGLPEEPIIGRVVEKQKIIDLLLSADTNNDEIVIVPIYGLGGIGKSTLAQQVYNDDQFNKYDHRIWVYVSQDFNLLKIGRSIISQLPADRGQQNSDIQQVINNCIGNLLCGKKVLVVLDDLWEDQQTELDKLKMMLHVKDSMIHVIVTTRMEDIARKFSTREPYKLQPFKNDICWEIIKRSSKFHLKSNKEKLEKIGLDIANKCGGVALAAQAIGFMLRSKDDESGWKKINNSDILNEPCGDKDVLPSLKLSYERMPPQVRICFSYCAIFPKGHNIVEDNLVHQWIALGFIDRSKGIDCINILLEMSFLQVSKLPSTSKEHVVRYTMHDLVHDLARLTMAEELIVFDVAPKRNAHSIGQLKQLRCLIAPRMQNKSLPEFITELAKLQYLNINESCEITTLPESICKLGCLQYLGLSGCSCMSKLPESFGDLKSMVHLDMSGCTEISALPGSFGKLANLQHLELSNCSSLPELPESLCGITQLQHLNLSSCDCLQQLPESFGSLVELQYLNMSKCCLIKELPESMMKLQKLLHLDLSMCGGVAGWLMLGGLRGLTTLQHLFMSCMRIPHEESVVDDLGNLTNLKKLRICNCDISAVNFISALTKLEDLNLSYNNGVACLPKGICNLKRLQTLDLRWCRGLESLPDSIGALGLKSLLLEGCSAKLMDQASSLVHYSRTLPVFKVLADDVSGCRKLHLLEGAHHISELRIVSLENVRCLEESSKAKLADKHNLSKLTLEWTTGVDRHLKDIDLLEQLVPPKGLEHLCLHGYSCTGFPGWVMDISRHLTNLISIILSNLPNCSNLPPLGQLPHLEKLEICNLPGIKEIGWEFCGGNRAFRRLSSLDIMSMEGLEEWSTAYYTEDGVEEFMFPVLDNLIINYCPRLRLKPCPPTFRECGIYSSDQVLSSFEEVRKISHHTCCTRATKLELGRMHCQSMEVFHHFSALQVLEISCCNKLTSLPESMRHLSFLRSLTLEWCEGISALPEWLGDLSSLKTFVIDYCESIKSLPSCIHQLKDLEKLKIRDNRELKEWCESEENKMKLGRINVERCKSVFCSALQEG
ncbi:hypothetical protein U9M48_001422 [Paspalum notatum var. saurae]|uniref:Uncharacterized protein n=1 Tax=Paspalum notatum var. saurae TaxID=547442 RepID=A0AAQ3PNI8_PASNO